jgi:nitroimidazol reductase NimA-like FMN-containing flavoprotein (pyridoxamine 5'-phosphate oxidase superfamily)
MRMIDCAEKKIRSVEGANELSLVDLESATGQRVLASSIPARLAFVRPDGQPDVVPIWFLWRDGQLVMCSHAGAFKVAALQLNPAVAISIDSESAPYESVRLRGLAEIEFVDGIPREYVDCAHRYYGKEQGDAWIAFVKPITRQMALITVTPNWAEVWDFRARFPNLFADRQENS